MVRQERWCMQSSGVSHWAFSLSRVKGVLVTCFACMHGPTSPTRVAAACALPCAHASWSSGGQYVRVCPSLSTSEREFGRPTSARKERACIASVVASVARRNGLRKRGAPRGWRGVSVSGCERKRERREEESAGGEGARGLAGKPFVLEIANGLFLYLFMYSTTRSNVQIRRPQIHLSRPPVATRTSGKGCTKH